MLKVSAAVDAGFIRYAGRRLAGAARLSTAEGGGGRGQAKRGGSLMEYPSKSRVELALTRLANEIGDDTAHPFRVELLKIHGGQPPQYTVVVLSPKRMLLCDRLGAVVGRSFSLGVRSFLLTVPEALKLILKYEGAESSDSALE